MAAKKQRKTAVNSGAKSAARVAQPHGGALLTGGVPGNRGGGRQPAILRELLRDATYERVDLLRQVADGKIKEASVTDRLRAMEILAKYGLGTLKEVSVENVRERVANTLDVIREHCSPEQATSIITALRPVWA